MNKFYVIDNIRGVPGYSNSVFRETKEKAAVYFAKKLNEEMVEENIDKQIHWKKLMKYIKQA